MPFSELRCVLEDKAVHLASFRVFDGTDLIEKFLYKIMDFIFIAVMLKISVMLRTHWLSEYGVIQKSNGMLFAYRKIK